MNASQESPNLDFLRSVAVLFVLVFHLLYLFERRQLPGMSQLSVFHAIGRWGVLIFFVHTSLVLMFSLERQQLRFPGKPSYIPFLTRRIFRIFPLSVFIVSLILALKLPLAYINDGKFMAAHLGWGGIASNFLLLQNLTHTDSVIIPLWSLPYEMQMYVFLPLLFSLVRGARYGWPIPMLWAAFAFLGSRTGWLERQGILDLVIFIPCFISGIISYKLTKTWRLRLPSFLWPVVLLLLTVFFLKSPTYQRAWYSCLLLGIAIPQFQEMTSPMWRKAFQIVARYSYGIYLTHFICVWLAFDAFGDDPWWSQWAILLVTVTVFPVILYHLLEKPMIRYGEKLAATLRHSLESPTFPAPVPEAAVD